jgi:predicted Fe-Mo cluster-binding NifX family protein
VIGDTDTMEFEAVDNTSRTEAGGAGIASAQTVAGKDAQVVLTGNCGPNAYQTLEAAGIQVITGVSGTVRDAIEGYKTGRFQAASGPTVSAHHGMSGGAGIAGTMSGRGMGRGGGRGCGAEQGAGADPARGDVEQDLAGLKAQFSAISRQLDVVMRRLENLERQGGP